MHTKFLVGLCALAITVGACSSSSDASHRVAARRPATTTTTVVPTTTTTTAPAPPPARTFSNATADDPALAAGDIAAAEAATLNPATSPEELRNAAVALQLAYRRISLRDLSVEQAVAAALPDDNVRRAMAYNVAAGRHIVALGGGGPPTKDAPPADWRIIAPAPSTELIAHYKEASQQTGVPWPILASVNFVETRLGRVSGLSSAGAQGPMQFLPATWAAYGKGDINSVRDSIATAARYLQANGAPERLDDALWRYNHSSHYVEAIKAYANRIAMDENSFRGYYEWQVTYRTKSGLLILPVGWPDVPAMNAGLSLV